MQADIHPGHPHEDVWGAAYPVALPVFTGPLHLLLDLLESRQLDISTVSLVTVTSSYLAALQTMDRTRVSSMCAFADVASRLLALKAGFLLPDTPMETDEGAEEDESLSLLAQLEQLQAYRSAVEILHEREDRGLRTYPRHAPLPRQTAAYTGQREAPARLQQGMRQILIRLSRMQPPRLIQKPLFTIENQIYRIHRALHRRPPSPQQAAPRLSFFHFFHNRSPRAEIVTAFLALLVMVHNRTVVATQKQPYGDIELHLRRGQGS